MILEPTSMTNSLLFSWLIISLPLLDRSHRHAVFKSKQAGATAISLLTPRFLFSCRPSSHRPTLSTANHLSSCFHESPFAGCIFFLPTFNPACLRTESWDFCPLLISGLIIPVFHSFKHLAEACWRPSVQSQILLASFSWHLHLGVYLSFQTLKIPN